MRASLLLFLASAACTTPRYAGLNWAEISLSAGDQAEAKQQLIALNVPPKGDLAAVLLARRANIVLPPTAADEHAAKVQTAALDTLAAQVAGQPKLARAAALRLAHAKRAEEALSLAPGAALKALLLVRSGRAGEARPLLAQLAKNPTPGSDEVRSVHAVLRALSGLPSPEERQAMHFLGPVNAPSKALEILNQAKASGCRSAVLRGLALESLGRVAGAAQAYGKETCSDAQTHLARVSMSTHPAAARVRLADVLADNPLHRLALDLTRRHTAVDAPEHANALARLVAWFPADTEALRSALTALERDKNWPRAHALADRSLNTAYNDKVHLIALRYLALAGANNPASPRHSELLHRLRWLTARRPDLVGAAALLNTVESGQPVDTGLGEATSSR
jgi:hypothetical protein